MNPREVLAELCRRHQLSASTGAPLLPLLELAARAEGAARQRMVAIAEATLAREAARRAADRELAHVGDEQCLRAMARALHGWRAPELSTEFPDEPDAGPGSSLDEDAA